MNALELRGLTKHYKDFTLGPLDLTLPGGTICGLIGENGAGKSITIKLILDMLQKDGGTVTILGRDNRTASVRTKEEIGVVLGSEMSGGIRNVVVSSCVFYETDRGIRLKTRRGRGGTVEGIQLNPVQEHVMSNYAYFPVIFHEKQFGFTRNEVHDRLAQENIFSRKYFYPLTNTYDCFHGAYDVSETPVALEISRRVLTLPLYADLPLEEVDHICDIILGMRN